MLVSSDWMLTQRTDEQNRAHERFEVLWPLARRTAGELSASPRLADLSGKTVAELWDILFRGDIIYPALRDALRARFPGIRFIEYPALGTFHGPHSKEIVGSLPDKLHALGCDAVIAGIGA